ncbi:MAG: hypothetical protein N2112_17245, partial [Gemmataceae bacterium]|nr:hypothetical protein [Gemmataceae bacterium]
LFGLNHPNDRSHKGVSPMSSREGWAFLCLMGCCVTITISLSLLSGIWQAVGCVLAALLGIVSGGLYAASVTPPTHQNQDLST